MTAPAVRARELTRRFGPLVALRPLDLELEPGETLAVLGPNGAGKSTLLRLLAGLSRPSGGQLEIGTGGASRAARRAGVGLIGHATFLYGELTVRENLELAARLHGLSDARERAERGLAALDLGAFAERPAGTLSRGLAQRVAIARALVHDPGLVLLDEPFTGLDPRAASRLVARLRELSAAGRACVLVTHDLEHAAALADRVLVLVRGRARRLAPEALSSVSALAAAYHEAVARLENP